MRNRKIDIIIPAYKGHNTIWQTLSSIASQTIIDDIETTIANDCCTGGDYQEFVNMFSPYMKIREVKTDKNGGPGVARQKGIDSTNNEYIAFIDDDDIFYCATAIETLRNAIEEPVSIDKGSYLGSNYACVTSPFLEETRDGIIKHPCGYTAHTHGKLYKREFLEKYNVHFSKSRTGEDVGFNTWVRMLCSMPENSVNDIDSLTYLWKYNEISISRANNFESKYVYGFCNDVDNGIWAFENAKKSKVPDDIIKKFIIDRMIALYRMYIVWFLKEAPMFATQAWEYIKKFYHAVYEPVKNSILDQEFFNEFAIDSMKRKLHNSFVCSVFNMSIQEFMRKLESEEYNPDDIKRIWADIPEELKQTSV